MATSHKKKSDTKKISKLKNQQELILIENYVLGEMYTRLKEKQTKEMGLAIKDLTLMHQLRMQI